MSLLLLCLGIGGVLFAQEPDDLSGLTLWDGMESKGNWNVSNKNKISSSAEYVTQGRTSLRINSDVSVPASGVKVTKQNTYLDLSFAQRIVFDVYNSGSPCQVAVALYAGQRYESIPRELASGMNNNVTFELNAKDFKFIMTSENIAQAVELIIYSQDDKIKPIYIDNIRVKKLGGLQSLPPGISPAAGALVAEGLTPVETTPVYTGPYSVGAFPRAETVPIGEPLTLFLVGTGIAGFFLSKRKDTKR